MGMEIERKWMVQGWPEGCPLQKEEEMRQGYVSVRPTVRIREEKLLVMNEVSASTQDSELSAIRIDQPLERTDETGTNEILHTAGAEKKTAAQVPLKEEFILCFKSKGRLSRKEIEFPIEEARFRELEDLIGLPLIPKLRRTYQLPDGHQLEVNHVDEGAPTEFWYAEVEFGSEDEARAFDPAAVGLGEYLTVDVTEQPGQSMGAYWATTRLQA